MFIYLIQYFTIAFFVSRMQVSPTWWLRPTQLLSALQLLRLTSMVQPTTPSTSIHTPLWRQQRRLQSLRHFSTITPPQQAPPTSPIHITLLPLHSRQPWRELAQEEKERTGSPAPLAGMWRDSVLPPHPMLVSSASLSCSLSFKDLGVYSFLPHP